MMFSEPRTQRYRTEDVQSDAGSFSDLLLPQHLVHALAAAGFVRPSPVQKAAIPIGRVGTDLIVQAKSGTGKTAVFATLLLERVNLSVNSPQAIVVAPTRELAVQSFQVIERIASALPQPAPSAAVFVGGLPTADDTKRLRRVCHIAVGTPGRLCALVTSGALLLGKIKAVVLDEADQLLSEAFYPDTAWLLQQLPKRKQVLAFSATYTPELLGDLEPLMRRPQKVLLCEETVSLLGIRQFYKLVGEHAANGNSSSSNGAAANTDSRGTSTNSTAANGVCSSSGTAANSGSSTTDAAAEAEAEAPAAAPADAANGTEGAHAAASGDGADATSAGPGPKQDEEQQEQQQQDQQQEQPQQQQQQQEQKLSLAEQQALLLLKVDALLQLLSSVSFHQAVVFCNRKPTAEWLARRLTAAGCPSAHLSSDLPQAERMAAMEAVRGFKVRLVVSTDVMARGVDFDRVNLVVNVDLPPDAATYVHRVGRTGRFGSRGVAVALVSQQELQQLRQYLADVKGGDISPLPGTIPADLYSYELATDWERDALKQLLAASTGTPPDSPPPIRKQRPPKSTRTKQQQQGQEQQGDEEGVGAAAGDADATAAAAAAAAAALAAFGYDAGSAALSCLDWGPDETLDWQQQQQGHNQQQQQLEDSKAAAGTLAAAAAGADAPGAAAAAGAVNGCDDPAAAWEAWANYYRSLGYWYDHPNPYLTLGAAAAAAGGGGEGAGANNQQQQQRQHQQEDQQQLSQQQQQEDEEQEVEEKEGWELPDEDEVDDRARLLLSRLHVTQEAAAMPATPAVQDAAAAGALAAGAAGGAIAAAGEGAAGSSAAGALPGPPSPPRLPAHDEQQHQQQQHGGSLQLHQQRDKEEAVCWQCWAAGYTAWQQQYEAWRQQYSAWCQQYQQQQARQYQQYMSWCDQYQQLCEG